MDANKMKTFFLVIFVFCCYQSGEPKIERPRTTPDVDERLCTDPDEGEKFNTLEVFKYTTGLLGVDAIAHLFERFDDRTAPVNQTTFARIGMTDCFDGNLTAIYERALCPWHNHVTVREDRYPFLLSNARCNCADCIEKHSEDTRYRCEEVIRKTPGLKRSPVCVKGKFEWKPIMENVSVACVCAKDVLIILVK
jgi:hypothetical protein